MFVTDEMRVTTGGGSVWFRVSDKLQFVAAPRQANKAYRTPLELRNEERPPSQPESFLRTLLEPDVMVASSY